MFGTQDGNKVNGKKVGVTVPQAQRSPAQTDPNLKYAPAMKVTNMAECSMVLVRYGDKDGMAHQVCLLKVGKGDEARFFMPPGAEQWTTDLRPVAPWLATELAKEQADIEKPNEVPAQDSVDINASPGV
jgi:hypothetical protein